MSYNIYEVNIYGYSATAHVLAKSPMDVYKFYKDTGNVETDRIIDIIEVEDTKYKYINYSKDTSGCALYSIKYITNKDSKATIEVIGKPDFIFGEWLNSFVGVEKGVKRILSVNRKYWIHIALEDEKMIEIVTSD